MEYSYYRLLYIDPRNFPPPWPRPLCWVPGCYSPFNRLPHLLRPQPWTASRGLYAQGTRWGLARGAVLRRKVPRWDGESDARLPSVCVCSTQMYPIDRARVPKKRARSLVVGPTLDHMPWVSASSDERMLAMVETGLSRIRVL